MNSLESRIHSDAAAAAADITPADIPPLRLADAPGRAARRARGRQTRARRWLVPLAAAASVVVISTVVVAVAGTRHPARQAAHPAASATSHPAHPASGALAAEVLDWYFPASGAQYTAGLAYEWNQRKITAQIFGSCMARAGYPQPPFTESERTYQESFPDNSQFPDLAQRAALHSMGGPDYIAGQPSAPSTPAGRKAVRTCDAMAAKPFGEIGKIAGPLQTQWDDEVANIQSSARVRATQPSFAHCLQTQGVPAHYAQWQDTGASNPLFAGFFAWADSLSQTATSTRQQASDDRRSARVFVQCAPPTVHLVETLQLAQRARFFARHAQQTGQIATLAGRLPGAGA